MVYTKNKSIFKIINGKKLFVRVFTASLENVFLSTFLQVKVVLGSKNNVWGNSFLWNKVTAINKNLNFIHELTSLKTIVKLQNFAKCE